MTSRNGGKWTEGRYKAFITAVLRSGMRRWPPKYGALSNACTGRKLNKKSGRKALHYKCAECSGKFLRTEVQVDHILPVVDPFKGFVNWDTFIERLYCEESNLQILCKKCHKGKTKKDKLCDITSSPKKKKSKK